MKPDHLSILAPVEWRITPGLTHYAEAVAWMEARAAAIAQGAAKECVWLVEHPPLYTAGTSARAQDLVDARFPVHATGRGGQYTYHGPGQRVAYVLLNLKSRKPDVRAFVGALEGWMIAALARFQVRGRVQPGRVGVWVERPEKPRGANGEVAEDKVAAIGIRVRQWVSFHGISLNVAPDLSHFTGIVPCGIAEPYLGVTSLAELGVPVTMDAVDNVLQTEFAGMFGPVIVGDSNARLG